MTARRGAPRFRYSRWDGTQIGFDIDADGLFEQLTDDLLYHGDLNASLRQLLRNGFQDRNGESIQGLNEMLERLREQRRQRLAQHDLGGAFEDIAQRLRDVVDQERSQIAQDLEAAHESGDPRRSEAAEAAANDRNLRLDLLSPDLSNMVRELQQYEFTSAPAQERFEELLDELRQQLVQRQFNAMAEGMANMSPEDLARTKDMFAELNQLLEARQRGEDTQPAFEEFMGRYGDLFPEGPTTLDELLEAMARRMAAMSALMNSMSPEQRAQLQDLSNQLLGDLDLRWQVDQLGENLRQLFPQMGWEASYDFQGMDPLDLAGAAQVLEEMGDLDQLEQLLRGASNPGALAEVDTDRVRQLLGEETAQSVERLSELARMLEERGLATRKDGRLELTPLALRKLGSNALRDLFRKLDRDRLGSHQIERIGIGHERSYETKPYEFGDPFNLSIERTVRNALGRTGGGTPVRLSPEDFEIEQTELATRTSTVLMVDLSMSMSLNGSFLAAKKVAMALQSLISSRFPRDYLGIVGFASVAKEITPAELPEVSWDFEYGTNMQHGLLLSRRLLGRQTGTKQIIMVTDGEPTSHFEPGMTAPFFNYPPTRATVDATLLEVHRCTREGIRINVFTLDEREYLRAFVEQLTEMNGGRAFHTTPENLGDYVLVDFVEGRRRGGGRRRTA